MEPVRIAPLAEAALRIHYKKIAAKEIRLLKRLPGGVVVEGNPGAMLQVFSNLISNAVEALAPKGILQIRARCTDGEAHILFADNGHGIPAAIRLRMFEPILQYEKGEWDGAGVGDHKSDC